MSLAKIVANEPFRTTGTASYPPAIDLAIAEAIVGSFGEDWHNSGARKQGAAGARPVGGAGVPLPAVLGQGSHTASIPGALEQGSHSHTASSSTAKSSTSAQASQAVSAGGSHLAADSSTKAQASQAATARSCHSAAVSSTSAQASQALGGRGPPIQVTYKSTTRSLHDGGGLCSPGDGGGLCSPGRWPPGRRRLPGTPPALQFRRRSRRACGLGRGDSMMHRAVRGVPWLNWPVAN